MESDHIQQNSQEVEPISGWLAFFLWVGVGLGAVVGCIRTLIDIADVGWSPFFIIIFMSIFGSSIITAILTIIAFYKRKPNAVSLAITFIAMVFLDGVFSIVIAIIGDDDTMVKDIFRCFGWSIIWFTYLMCSQQVKRTIPKEIRCWKTTEKILLIVYILSCVVFCVGLKNMITDPTNTKLVSKEYLIKQTIEVMNEELPQNIDGMIFESVELQGLMIKFNYKYPQITLADMNIDYIKKYSIAHKQEILQGYAIETDEDVVKVSDMYFNNGYDVCYYYKDMNNQLVYSVVTTPSDYKKARNAGVNFRCDKNAWNELITQTNKELPILYMGDCYLNKVSVDFEKNVLKYEISLPKMEDEGAITKSYFLHYIQENIDALSDYLWMMANVDKMDLCFDFVSSTSRNHQKITIYYEEYQHYLE